MIEQGAILMTPDYMELQAWAESAYGLLCAFEDTINTALEGDHPELSTLQAVLLAYEHQDMRG